MAFEWVITVPLASLSAGSYSVGFSAIDAEIPSYAASTRARTSRPRTSSLVGVMTARVDACSEMPYLQAARAVLMFGRDRAYGAFGLVR
jgi:hypothetical protein